MGFHHKWTSSALFGSTFCADLLSIIRSWFYSGINQKVTDTYAKGCNRWGWQDLKKLVVIVYKTDVFADNIMDLVERWMVGGYNWYSGLLFLRLISQERFFALLFFFFFFFFFAFAYLFIYPAVRVWERLDGHSGC